MGKGLVFRGALAIVTLVIGALIANIHLLPGLVVIAIALGAGLADRAWNWLTPRDHGAKRLIAYVVIWFILSALSIWGIQQFATGYYVSYVTCGAGVQKSPTQLRGYRIGYGILNRNNFPLYFQYQEASFTLMDQALPNQTPSPATKKVYPLKETKKPAYVSSYMPFRFAVNPNPKPLEGTFRWVAKYGKNPGVLDHTLIVSGPFTLEYRTPGAPEIRLSPLGDSSDHSEGPQNCDF
jgi:hypothetical protein